MNAVSESAYLLGHASQEHVRLIRQAETLAPHTSRLLRLAGIARGQLVLDIGSGVGDVAQLAAELVGTSGRVVGLERDPNALRVARRRAGEAGAAQIEFRECDLNSMRIEGQFDAIVGRFVLMFLPDPGATIRRLVRLLRPGGVFVSQEPAWSMFYPACARLPLRAACGRALCDAFIQSGARPDMGLELHAAMLAAGLTEPRTVIEVPTTTNAHGDQWLPDLLATVRSRTGAAFNGGEWLEPMGTLSERLGREVDSAKAFAPLVPLIGTYARSVPLSLHF